MTDLSKLSDADLAAIAAGDLSKVSDEGLSHIVEKQESAKPSNLDVIGNALWKGVASIPDALLNTPTNIANLGIAGFGSAATALGRPDLAPNVLEQPDYIARGLKNVGLIRDVVPQTAGQRILDVAGQFAGGGLINPAGSLKGMLTNVAVGGLTGAAGQATSEATGSPLAGALASMAVPAGAFVAKTIGKKPNTVVPSIDELKAASTAAYQKAEQAGAVFKPSAYDNFVNSIVPDIKKAGFDADLHPKAAAVLKRLIAEQGQPQTLENMEILRRVAKNAAASPDASERNIGRIIQDKLDDFVSNAGPSDIMGGNPSVAVPALQEARKFWSQASKADTIETLMDRARLSAPNFSGSGMENAIRTEFRALAKNDRKMRLFSQDEQDAIRKVAMGGPVENAFRMIGKFSPTGVVSSGLSTGTGYLLGGPVGAAAVPAAGMISRKIATALTNRNAQRASELMRGTMPAPQMPQTALARLLGSYSSDDAQRAVIRAALQNQGLNQEQQ